MNHRLPLLPRTPDRLCRRARASLRRKDSLPVRASRPGKVSPRRKVNLRRKASRPGKVSLRRRVSLRVRVSRLGKVSLRVGVSLPRTASLRRTVNLLRKVSHRPRAKPPQKVNHPRMSPAPARGKDCRRGPVPGPHSALVGAYRLAARHVMSAEIGGTTAASCVRSRAGGATGSRPVAALCGRSADNRVLRQRPAAGCGGCFGGGRQRGRLVRITRVDRRNGSRVGHRAGRGSPCDASGIRPEAMGFRCTGTCCGGSIRTVRHGVVGE
jgi:hypothetical protein